MPSLAQRGVAECLGTAFLLAAVVGSGIMAQKLAGGNNALALLCNTLPTASLDVTKLGAVEAIAGSDVINAPPSDPMRMPCTKFAMGERGETARRRNEFNMAAPKDAAFMSFREAYK